MNNFTPGAVVSDNHETELAARASMEIATEKAQKARDLTAEVWLRRDELVAVQLVPYDMTIAELAANARILIRVGVGVDNADHAVWSARGMPVCEVPDFGIGEVLGYALATCVRQLTLLDS